MKKKNLLLFFGVIALSACNPSKEEILERWREKSDSVAKHKADSTVNRLNFVISAVSRGATEEQANRIYDTACVDADRIFGH